MECKPLLILASRLKFKTITITEIAPQIHNLKYENFDISVEEEKLQMHSCTQLLKLSATQNKTLKLNHSLDKLYKYPPKILSQRNS